jgi:SAM-dependent methyltransferase
MDHPWILPVTQYYARLNAYILEFGLPWPVEDCQNWDEEAERLRGILGEANNRCALDCSCGWGRQTIALAKLGWQVTACDLAETSLEFARKFALREEVSVDFQVYDMGNLAQAFHRQFDCVVSCYALYEIPTVEGIRKAVRGMLEALKPGGKCYLRFRDMDFLLEEQPQHIFHGEKRCPNGRMICIEDWEYESEEQVIALYAFLREDERLDPANHFRWMTETIGVRKRVMRKAELRQLLRQEGFEPVIFLPQPEPWYDVQVVAERPT